MTGRRATQQAYLVRRVLDAFLREDVGECASRGRVVDALPEAIGAGVPGDVLAGAWLTAAHLGDWYLPVAECRFMQDWRARAACVVHRDTDGTYRPAWDLERIVKCFLPGEDGDGRAAREAFIDECRVAVEHGVACAELRHDAARDDVYNGHDQLRGWVRAHLQFERVAAFQDHPFYPTARAKLGFGVDDLAHFGPESGRSFSLRWMAVPLSIYRAQHDVLPEWWPTWSDVGLPASLAMTHRLVPVHPFSWRTALDAWLLEAGLKAAVIKAPHAAVPVLPTLSVRSLVVVAKPRQHLKVPLPIRTLGARNIRTIKPSTVSDGARMQALLGDVRRAEPWMQEHLLLTDEARGATVAGKPFLGFILREYPNVPDDSLVVPVAALVARGDDGIPVYRVLAETCYGGDVVAFFRDYVRTTLRLHLTLWLRYGIALESNQQNSLVVLSPSGGMPRLRLLLKDNDAGRVWSDKLSGRVPTAAGRLRELIDRRIVVTDEASLFRMFVTITFHLNIAVWVEHLITDGVLSRGDGYLAVARMIDDELKRLDAMGNDTRYARQVLLHEARHPAKYLLRAASLEDKRTTGASDVNKFYGISAPNPLAGRVP